ncbi:MAG: DUF4160 domain-containing protein [Parachlamydiaceae bacterium]
MPEISRFFGITIKMFYDDHNPPHFHAEYGSYRAIFSIDSGQIIEGDLPSKKSALITAWTIIHQKELKYNWKMIKKSGHLKKIKPLE